MTTPLVPVLSLAEAVRETVDPATLNEMVVHYSIPALEQTGAPVVEDPADIKSLKLLLSGDELLVSRLNPRKGRVTLTQPHDNLLLGSTEFVALRAREGTELRYLRWVMLSETTRQALDAEVRSATRSHQRVDPEVITHLRVPAPPLDEQRRIADFLDHQVSLLDRATDLRRAQAALASERYEARLRERLAGPETDAWKPVKLKYLARVQRGASPRPIDNPAYFDEEGSHAWVRIADVTASAKVLLNTTQRLSDLGLSLSVPLKPGELVVSIAGSVGKPVITGIECCIHDGFVAIREPRIHRDIIYYTLVLGDVFAGLGNLGTQLNLNSDIIRNLVIKVPPPGEQSALVARMDADAETHRRMGQLFNRSIALLNERKQAVITGAVTGEFDVTTARSVA